MTTLNEKDLHNALFIQLVLQFQTSAMIGMGKLKNPITDKVEVNLDQAKISIDMLDMIKTKMKGNLSEEEDRFITTVIRDLKLNYVDEVNKKQTETQKAIEKTEEKT